jgi:hypothetical protein
MKDEAILTIIFLAVVLATLTRTLLVRGQTTDSSNLQSTGDPLLDEIYRDHPGLRR